MNNDIQTPFNREAEHSVLGALLMDNSAIDRVADLKMDHFYVQEHKTIYAEIRRQIVAGEACDVITAGIALTGKIPEAMVYLNDLMQSTPSAANIARYAGIVTDAALRRGLIAETSRIADIAMRPNGKSSAQVLDIAQTAIGKLAEARSTRDPIRASDAMIAHADVLQDRIEKKVRGIPTGFAKIDAILNGGLNRGALVILGARPSMGKSAIALNIAANCARDYSVLFLSQEMTIGELLDRTNAQLGRIPLGSVISGEMTDDEWTRFSYAGQKLSDLNLHFDEQPALTLLEVRSKAQIMKRRHGLDILIIDYLQLMSGDGSNRNAEIEEITRGLKALAKELGIVVIALSQLSRNAANKQRPGLADLRDSGAIEQDADIVAFLHREEVENPQSNMQGLADIFIAKNRQGRIDDVLLGYVGEYTLFEDFDGHRPAAPAEKSRSFRNGLASAL